MSCHGHWRSEIRHPASCTKYRPPGYRSKIPQRVPQARCPDDGDGPAQSRRSHLLTWYLEIPAVGSSRPKQLITNSNRIRKSLQPIHRIERRLGKEALHCAVAMWPHIRLPGLEFRLRGQDSRRHCIVTASITWAEAATEDVLGQRADQGMYSRRENQNPAKTQRDSNILGPPKERWLVAPHQDTHLKLGSNPNTSGFFCVL